MSDFVKDTNVPTNGCISRQAAIDALADMHCKSDEDGYVWIIRSDAWARIDALPSAQPEIIRCKSCRHDNNCEIQYAAQAGSEFFCGAAERREE